MEIEEVNGERRGRQGRRFASEERRRELVAAFGESGLTRQEFARRGYTTLCNWVQRNGKVSEAAPPQATMRYAEVALPPASPGRGFEVRLPDGTTLRGEDAQALAALVGTLRA